jgi:hypothetical protein
LIFDQKRCKKCGNRYMDDFMDELITYYRKYQEKIYERVILAQNGDAKQLLKPKEKNG